MMREANQVSIPDGKKVFRNIAAWYAIVVPAVSAACILFFMETKNSLLVPPWVAALIFISSLIMGILSLFGRSVEVGIRVVVFVGMLVSAIFGGLAIFAWFLSGFRC